MQHSGRGFFAAGKGIRLLYAAELFTVDLGRHGNGDRARCVGIESELQRVRACGEIAAAFKIDDVIARRRAECYTVGHDARVFGVGNYLVELDGIRRAVVYGLALAYLDGSSVLRPVKVEVETAVEVIDGRYGKRLGENDGTDDAAGNKLGLGVRFFGIGDPDCYRLVVIIGRIPVRLAIERDGRGARRSVVVHGKRVGRAD